MKEFSSFVVSLLLNLILLILDLLNLLVPYGLQYEDLDKECDDSLLIEVSRHLQLIDHIKLGHCLNLSSKTMESITQDKQDDVKREIDMLWNGKQ